MMQKPKLFALFWILTTVFLSISLQVFAQRQAVEQIRTQIDSLNELGSREFFLPDSMVIKGREAYRLSLDIAYPRGEARALNLIGQYEHYKTNFDSALVVYNEALSIFRTLDDELDIAHTMLSIAIVYNNTNNQVKSIEYGMEALKTYEKFDDKKGIGKVFNLLGISWAMEGELEKAKTYFLQYNALASLGTDAVNIGYSFNNLGSVYRDLGQSDSALYYFTKGEGFFAGKSYLPGMFLISRNIGSVYYTEGDYKQALTQGQKSLDIAQQTGATRSLGISLHDIAKAHARLGQTAQAIQYFNRAIEEGDKINENHVLRESHFELHKLMERRGDYRKALHHHILAKAYNDSLFSAEKTQIYADLEKKYQTEKKEQQIEILNQETAIQRLQLRQRGLFLLVAFGVIVAGAVTVSLVFKQRKLKAEAHLQHEIRQQQEQTTRAVLDAEEQERRRIAGDLHDGVGQILSTALLNLNYMNNELKVGTPFDAAVLDDAIQLVEDSYDEMRSISHQIMPNALIKSGLVSAVREFVNKIDSRAIKITLNVLGLENRLDGQTETVLYRVIQESINNVIKHAKASHLSLQLMQDDEGITLAIEDNGVGFDYKAVSGDMGIGFKNMRSRLEILKGFMEVDSAPGKGTVLTIFVPR